MWHACVEHVGEGVAVELDYVQISVSNGDLLAAVLTIYGVG